MTELLARLVAALLDIFGESALRAACDEQCAIRKSRAAADAEADARLGPDTEPSPARAYVDEPEWRGEQ